MTIHATINDHYWTQSHQIAIISVNNEEEKSRSERGAINVPNALPYE